MTDLHYWLALSTFLNPAAARRWLAYFENGHALFSASNTRLKEAGLTEKQIIFLNTINWKNIEKNARWIEQSDCHAILSTDPRYPKLLLEIHDAPLVLYIRGDVELLSKSQIAMVGSRNPSTTGRELAADFAECLAASGFIITSGLALGIDAASHRGALNAPGKTIAIMGTGLQYIYPSSHRKLADDILKSGALVSEFLPDSPPKALHFPLRNRVISGLSLGTLIVEAALKSGSLITARCAMEQNREVFAIPSSIHNPLARGCHALIRQGAKLVETADDILEELMPLLGTSKNLSHIIKDKEPPADQSMAIIWEQIGYELTATDVIIMRSGLTAGEVSSILLSLELEGYVRAVSGGYVRVMNKTI